MTSQWHTSLADRVNNTNQRNKIMTEQEKLKAFAELVAKEQLEKTTKQFGSHSLNNQYCNTRIVIGRKYTKIDVGSDKTQWSGKFMIESDGNIFGIKGYGVIHRGHHYGTLNTTNEWNWGDYYPSKRRIGMTKQEPKHTPGPWRLRELIDGSYAIYGKGEYDLIFPIRAGLDANSQLIAAAPKTAKQRDELLEVCKNVMTILEEWGQDSEMDEAISFESDNTTLTEVIQKAEATNG